MAESESTGFLDLERDARRLAEALAQLKERMERHEQAADALSGQGIAIGEVADRLKGLASAIDQAIETITRDHRHLSQSVDLSVQHLKTTSAQLDQRFLALHDSMRAVLESHTESQRDQAEKMRDLANQLQILREQNDALSERLIKIQPWRWALLVVLIGVSVLVGHVVLGISPG